MKLLLTGASGFLGRHILAALPARFEVVAVAHRSADFEEYVDRAAHCKVTVVRADLTTSEGAAAVARAGNEYEAAVFLAANSDPALSVEQPAFDLLSNAVSVLYLMERIRMRKLVYFSSGAVYDRLKGPVTPASSLRPLLPYAISKLTAERYLESLRDQGAVETLFLIRFFGAYGPMESPRKIYGRLVRQFAIEQNPEISIRGDGRNLIDAMYIDDAVRVIHRLLDASGEGGIYDLASRQPITLKALVEIAAAVFGIHPRITCEGQVPEYIEFFSADSSLQERFGFVPKVTLQDGLRRMAEYVARSTECPPVQPTC